MPNPKRLWTEDDILRSMAGKFPAKKIATELGRSAGVTLVEASKLKIPLRKRSGASRLTVRAPQGA